MATVKSTFLMDTLDPLHSARSSKFPGARALEVGAISESVLCDSAQWSLSFVSLKFETAMSKVPRGGEGGLVDSLIVDSNRTRDRYLYER